jgi:hypothetical protein
MLTLNNNCCDCASDCADGWWVDSGGDGERVSLVSTKDRLPLYTHRQLRQERLSAKPSACCFNTRNRDRNWRRPIQKLDNGVPGDPRASLLIGIKERWHSRGNVLGKVALLPPVTEWEPGHSPGSGGKPVSAMCVSYNGGRRPWRRSAAASRTIRHPPTRAAMGKLTSDNHRAKMQL